MSITDKIFLNLPVRDVAKTIKFYEALGATKNPLFSDDSGACLVLSDHIYIMVLGHEKFGSFIPGRAIADPNAAVSLFIAISQDSRDAVNALVDKAAAAGATPDITPADDYGFMFGRNFADPEGYLWNVFWMDPVAAEKGPAAMAEAAA
ncbi:MAG: lactoylglutathione lyase [Sphingomonadales bacterium]